MRAHTDLDLEPHHEARRSRIDEFATTLMREMRNAPRHSSFDAIETEWGLV
jgi:hypothetical protein